LNPLLRPFLSSQQLMMAFPYKKIVVIGATSGIGQALATKFVENSIEVVVVGRRREKLEEFVSSHGTEKAAAELLDITDLDNIPSFASKLVTRHSGIDAVLINSGMQRGFDFSKPEGVDLAEFDMEWKTNYTSYVHLTKAFLPFLQSHNEKQTALLFMSSGLALVPLPRVPGYCATKAALHQFILSLREQLRPSYSHMRVIEIFPPAVQTELHDWMETEQEKRMGMPLDDFIEATWRELQDGNDQPAVGFAKVSFDRFESARQAAFGQLVERSRLIR
jgi:short-subunit dehydrogenase involved in D-alanine esterification of teichoic acids